MREVHDYAQVAKKRTNRWLCGRTVHLKKHNSVSSTLQKRILQSSTLHRNNTLTIIIPQKNYCCIKLKQNREKKNLQNSAL